jgi:hypothetical protein
MPTKPATPESTAPIRKPIAASAPRRGKRARKITPPTMAIAVYCRLR